MNNNIIYLAPECLGESIELVGVTPDMYVNGVRQDEPVGYRYDVILRDHHCDKLSVHIAGKQLMDEPLSGQSLAVVFDDLRVRPYVNRTTGKLAYTATAAGIKPMGNIVPKAKS